MSQNYFSVLFEILYGGMPVIKLLVSFNGTLIIRGMFLTLLPFV